MGRTPIQALTEAPVWVWQENDRPRQEIYHLLVQSGADPTVVSATVSGDVDGIRGFLDRDAPFIHMEGNIFHSHWPPCLIGQR